MTNHRVDKHSYCGAFAFRNPAIPYWPARATVSQFRVSDWLNRLMLPILAVLLSMGNRILRAAGNLPEKGAGGNLFTDHHKTWKSHDFKRERRIVKFLRRNA